MRRKIGEWIADDSTDTLRRGDTVQKLERRAMAVLQRLADTPGTVVSKDTLIEDVWGDVAVSDHSAAIVISQLRRALGDDKAAPNYIKTIPKRGYQLVASVGDAGAPHRVTDAGEPKPQPRVNRLMVGILAGFATLLVTAFVALRNGAQETVVLVASFENSAGDAQSDVTAFAMSELVTSQLVSRSRLRVVRWRGPVDDAAAAFPRGSILSARLIDDGGRKILATQLADGASGALVHGGAYDLTGQSLLERAAALADDIAGAVGSVEDPEPALADVIPAEAHHLYWQARYAASLRSHDSLREARDLLVQLTSEHPGFAAGHAALADIYAHKTGEHLGLPRVDTFAEAEAHLAEARRHGGETSETAVTASLLVFYRDRNAQKAAALAREATGLDPSNANAWQTLGMIESAVGRDREALDAIARARALDPLNPSILWDRVWFLYTAGRYEAALAAAQEATQHAPAHDLYLSLIHEALGNQRDAYRAWLRRVQARGFAGAPNDDIAEGYADMLAAAHAGEYEDGGATLAILAVRAGDASAGRDAILQSGPPRDSWFMLWAGRLPELASLKDDAEVRRVLSRLDALPQE